jgi:hypothetical protein
MEWVANDGTLARATFGDALDAVAASQRLRTALSTGGEWLPAVLAKAHRKLGEVRAGHPDAAGLVIAIDQDHARGIAAIMRQRLGVTPVVAVSEDPAASSRIAAFGQGADPWIVAVRMLSEGVDIPRLRVGVYATTTTTELFFRQAVGRLVRWTRGLGAQPSHMFIPDDPRLRAHAHAIAEGRLHSLRRVDADGEPLPEGEPQEVVEAPGPGDQMSMFAAISAVATEDAPGAGAWQPAPAATLDEGVLLELAPAPRVLPPDPGDPEGRPPASPRQRRRELRDANASLVRLISRLTGRSHQQVNAELNRRVGVERVGEATLEQLERRRREAVDWLAAA